MTRIYLSPPEVGPDERATLLEAFDSNWIAPAGPDIDAFEREVAERTGVEHAVALSSGTAALHLSLLLAGVEPGDEVLVPSFTFIASAAAATYVGARPVFVDCSPESWNLDPALAEEALLKGAARGRLPAAVITVDLYGETADYAALEALCVRFDVPLIEDSAEAVGSTHRGRAAGSFGAAGVFSFNGNKIITTSGGGMLVADSAELVDRALSNLLAALGRAQLRGLPSRMARRQQIDAAYREGLAGLPGISPMPRTAAGTPNYWLTCVLIDPATFGADREQVRLALEEADIESRPTWKPLHLQPAFSGIDLIGPGHCARIFERGLCLPTGSALTPADQARIIDIIGSQARA